MNKRRIDKTTNEWVDIATGERTPISKDNFADELLDSIDVRGYNYG